MNFDFYIFKMYDGAFLVPGMAESLSCILFTILVIIVLHLVLLFLGMIEVLCCCDCRKVRCQKSGQSASILSRNVGYSDESGEKLSVQLEAIEEKCLRPYRLFGFS